MKIRFSTPEILIFIILIMSPLLQMGPFPSWVGVYLPMLFGIVCFLYCYSKYKTLNEVKRGIIICLFMSVSMLFSIVFVGNASVYHILNAWGYMGVAVLLITNKDQIRERVFDNIFLIVAAIIIVLSLIGKDAQDVFSGTSRNTVSALLIFYTVIIYGYKYDKDKTKSYIYVLITIIISIWAEGRTGVLLSVAFLIAVLINNSLIAKTGRFRSIILIAILSVITLYVISRYYSSSILNIQDNYQIHGMNTLRTTIWTEYIEIIKGNPIAILFGGGTTNSGYYWIDRFQGNLHNSFFMLHSRYGLLPFIFVTLRLVVYSIELLKRKRFFEFICLLIFLIRSCLDWVGFPGLYDILFYYYILESYNTTVDSISTQVAM